MKKFLFILLGSCLVGAMAMAQDAPARKGASQADINYLNELISGAYKQIAAAASEQIAEGLTGATPIDRLNNLASIERITNAANAPITAIYKRELSRLNEGHRLSATLSDEIQIAVERGIARCEAFGESHADKRKTEKKNRADEDREQRLRNLEWEVQGLRQGW